MKINSINNENATSNKHSSVNNGCPDFNKLIAQLAKNKNEIHSDKKEISGAKSQTKLDFIYNKNLLKSSEIETGNFKSFIKDGISVNALQIKNEIDKICGDETGENIDMETLDEYLDMFINENDT